MVTSSQMKRGIKSPRLVFKRIGRIIGFNKMSVIIKIKLLETILLLSTFLVANYVKGIKKTHPRFLPKTYDMFSNCGWLPISFHYYQPIIKRDMLPQNYEKLESRLLGMDIKFTSQLELLKKFKYNDELVKIRLDSKNILEARYHNDFFGPPDAEILYNMIRYFKPNRVIEIGSGESTKFARLALEQNKLETKKKYEHICIEPFEVPWLKQIGVKILRNKVERCDISIFEQLSENDILFIDSSHVIRTQGDVLFEYLDIIPSLKKGVLVHCHDIFLPYEYPLKWIEKNKIFWNEQYILQALLSDSKKYEVILALNFLSKKAKHELQNCCPIFAEEEGNPGSFWFKVII